MRKFLAGGEFRLWLAIAGSVTLAIGAAYAMAQQSTRLSADDLPLTNAQTAKAELESGATPDAVVPAQIINLASNYNPFLIITDGSHHVLASSASLNGQTPLPPAGTFDFTAINGTDHFTWKPANNVRLATRLMSWNYKDNHGYIISGQSLKPYEDRENIYLATAVPAWAAALIWSYIFLLLPKAPAAKSRRAK
ncbi:MAG TPA: hypothetical protein VFP35_03930 [Candidatus Saccharimonadales bacterium]|nr:hypothetical protein [Candidatus Saccharimonadales bacterium]